MQIIKINKLMPVLLISSLVLVLAGCKSMNKGNTDYTAATELKALKFPARSLSVSTRYDIPPISGDREQIITEIVPPE